METGELANALELAPAGGGAFAADLPRVLHTAPAAVLMIDVVHRKVLYANAAASELTGAGCGCRSTSTPGATPPGSPTWAAGG